MNTKRAPHHLDLTDKQKMKLHNRFANGIRPAIAVIPPMCPSTHTILAACISTLITRRQLLHSVKNKKEEIFMLISLFENNPRNGRTSNDFANGHVVARIKRFSRFSMILSYLPLQWRSPQLSFGSSAKQIGPQPSGM